MAEQIPNEEFVRWICEREPRFPDIDTDFWVIEEAKIKTAALIKAYQNYLAPATFKLLEFNLIAHFIIATPFEYADGDEIKLNPLYTKYDIAERGKGIVTSASDESSSASIHTPEAYNTIDFMGIDLLSTPYGKYAYSMLSSVSITPVLL